MGEAGLAGWTIILNPDVVNGGPCRATSTYTIKQGFFVVDLMSVKVSISIAYYKAM